MIVSAILISRAAEIAAHILDFPLWKAWFIKHQDKRCIPQDSTLTNHTVLIGYGPGGKRVADFLRSKNEQIAVIELNERNVEGEQLANLQFIIGNAKEDQVLKRAAVEAAKQVIITVPEAVVAEDLTIKIRRLNHNATIIVRTQYAQEIEQLQKLGADRVIPAELSVAETIMAGI